MKTRARLFATLLALLVPVLVQARWTAGGAAGPPVALPTLPQAIGPWVVADEQRLSEQHQEMLMPDAHVWRLYEAPGRSPIWLYVAAYGGRTGYDGGAHDPEVCYPAQGWEIVDSRDVDVPLERATLRAKLLEAHQGGHEQRVLYWFQPAARWPRGAAVEQLARILDAVANRPQYAFVRLAAPGGQGFDATADLAEFAAQIAWPVRSGLEGNGAAALSEP
jgi:EpsI family protein